MKQVIRAVGAGMLALGILGTAGVARADEKVTLGVAIPTADHGFTGGIVWWAKIIFFAFVQRTLVASVELQGIQRQVREAGA